MPPLPPPATLERVCKGLAVLDAIVCPDWEYRYYSFNHAWNADGSQRMASMRNGSGDEWFIVFAPAGVFVKAFWHEYPHEDIAMIYAGLPTELEPQLHEPAFSMDSNTFGGWHDGRSWTLRGNAKAVAGELRILAGDPDVYRAYAAECFEVDPPVDAIAHVLAGNRLDEEVIRRINPQRTMSELADDLTELGY
jgi:hypothetical protein